MKKKIFTLILTVALTTMSTTTFATEIPRESTPLNATEKQTQIVENLIGDILDDVQTGNLGYTLAAGYANTKIRNAVITGETNGSAMSRAVRIRSQAMFRTALRGSHAVEEARPGEPPSVSCLGSSTTATVTRRFSPTASSR